MASLPSDQSQELDFVEELSRDFLCPVSLELLREPHQTLCCGNHISRDSVTRLQTARKPCPVCRKEDFKTLPDQYFKRKIRELKVRCSSKTAGCEWVGELGELERHLENCSLQDCEFSHLGCEVRVKRREISEHMEQGVKTHLSMACKTIEKHADTIEKHADTIEKQADTIERQKVVQQQQMRMISNLQQQIKQLSLHLKLKSLTKPVFVPPPTLVMTNFSQHKRDGDTWYSPPFYSHIGGYKMTLGVDADGWGDGKGTHVGAVIYLMRGEHDDDLSWPFRVRVTFQLVNQRVDQGHVEHSLHIDGKKDTISARVVGKERATSGFGQAAFISHTALSYDRSKNTEYLKDDHLEFCITKVTTGEGEINNWIWPR